MYILRLIAIELEQRGMWTYPGYGPFIDVLPLNSQELHHLLSFLHLNVAGEESLPAGDNGVESVIWSPASEQASSD